jgi:hypothetical protein
MAFKPFKKNGPLLQATTSEASSRKVTALPEKSIGEKGREGEQALADWFSDHGLAYVAVGQNKDTFARMFRQEVKRPDFLLLFDSLGMIAVDAKNITPYQPNKIVYYTLPLEEEVKKAISFERIFRMPVWYAVMENTGHGVCWHWISALKAVEVGFVETNAEKGVQFLKIKRDDFVRISTGADLAKLYLQRLPALKNLSSLPLGA